MTRTPVRSSRVASIGYDAESLTLEVQFMPNSDGRSSVWSYSGVGPQVAEQLMTATSIGREFTVVQRGYPGRPVATVEPDGTETREDAVEVES